MSRDGLDDPATHRLDSDADVDVAIVGAGLSGLWTAWALRQNDPDLSVAVFEAEHLGFGASGRNCGWLSAKPVGIRSVLSGVSGRDGVLAVEQQLRFAVHDVVRILGASNIDARHGGSTQVARSANEQRRIESYLAASRQWGVTDAHLELLSADEARRRIDVAGVTGALHTPDNYCVDPVKMLFTLARVVQDAGVPIYPDSRVTSIEPGRLVVRGHHVRVRRRIVVATEGYSSAESGRQRNASGSACGNLEQHKIVEREPRRRRMAAPGGCRSDGRDRIHLQETALGLPGAGRRRNGWLWRHCGNWNTHANLIGKVLRQRLLRVLDSPRGCF